MDREEHLEHDCPMTNRAKVKKIVDKWMIKLCDNNLTSIEREEFSKDCEFDLDLKNAFVGYIDYMMYINK